ncbi:MAG: ribonuclease HII [Nitrospirae bacterium]|nr:MAG: ribonuclease HII [Nitrospirota bacterium]
MPLYEHDAAFSRGLKPGSLIAGLDEAGRGPLAGPVVAAAVILPEGLRIEGVRDSKKVPEAEREALFVKINESASAIGIGIVDADDIDRINILCATRLAMYKAVSAMALKPDILLIDAVTIPALDIRQVPIIKGDAQSASIAAASIIAKVTRDRMMVAYHDKYPEYCFDKHKGYGTKTHLAMLKQHGPCPIHRKSFQKVMSLPLFAG